MGVTQPSKVMSQIGQGVLAFALLAWAGYGAFERELVLPAKNGLLRLHGLPAGLVEIAMLGTAALLILGIASRRAEATVTPDLERWSRRLRIAAGACFAVGLGLHVAGVGQPPASSGGSHRAWLGLATGLFVAVALWAQARASAASGQAAARAKVSVTRVLVAVFSATAILVGVLVFLAWPARPKTLSAEQMASDFAIDAAERNASDALPLELGDLQAHLRPSDLRERLAGHSLHARCYTDLRPMDRLGGDAAVAEVCWMPVREVFGLPVERVAFFFGEYGLRHVKVDFRPAAWEPLGRELDGVARRLPPGWLRTPGARQTGWIAPAALIQSEAAGKGKPAFTMLWSARETVPHRPCEQRPAWFRAAWPDVGCPAPSP